MTRLLFEFITSRSGGERSTFTLYNLYTECTRKNFQTFDTPFLYLLNELLYVNVLYIYIEQIDSKESLFMNDQQYFQDFQNKFQNISAFSLILLALELLINKVCTVKVLPMFSLFKGRLSHNNSDRKEKLFLYRIEDNKLNCRVLNGWYGRAEKEKRRRGSDK